jgi:hypothetical protein
MSSRRPGPVGRPLPGRRSEHPRYDLCRDAECPRLGCAAYREGRAAGYGDGYGDGYASGFSAGLAAAAGG